MEAKQLFLWNLKGASDPDTKKKIIGKFFIKTFEKKAQKKC